MTAQRDWRAIRDNLRDTRAVTEVSIAAAKATRDAERRAFTEATGLEVEDDGTLGLRLANFMSAAVYGPSGERR